MTPPAGPTKRRTVVACLDCGVHWSPLAEPARCVEGDHRHQHFEVHLHRCVIVLPDGTSVMACSFDPVDPYTRDRAPDYGFYLDPRWQPPWAHDHLRWPDFGVPANTDALTEALGGLLERARADEVVEIGCLGGHGRTGTALACLAIMTGLPAPEAVAWVRSNYCPSAVESAEQEALIARISA